MAMKQIVRGTSVPVVFTVMEAGKVKDMTAAENLKWSVKLKDYPMRASLAYEVVDYNENPYEITVATTSKTSTGVYVVTLEYTEQGKRRVVTAEAFRLVEYSPGCDCSVGADCSCLCCVTADTGIGMRGPVGPIGPMGPQGPTGNAAVISQVYAEELPFGAEPKVFNEGTETDAQLLFQLPGQRPAKVQDLQTAIDEDGIVELGDYRYTVTEDITINEALTIQSGAGGTLGAASLDLQKTLKIAHSSGTVVIKNLMISGSANPLISVNAGNITFENCVFLIKKDQIAINYEGSDDDAMHVHHYVDCTFQGDSNVSSTKYAMYYSSDDLPNIILERVRTTDLSMSNESNKCPGIMLEYNPRGTGDYPNVITMRDCRFGGMVDIFNDHPDNGVNNLSEISNCMFYGKCDFTAGNYNFVNCYAENCLITPSQSGPDSGGGNINVRGCTFHNLEVQVSEESNPIHISQSNITFLTFGIDTSVSLYAVEIASSFIWKIYPLDFQTSISETPIKQRIRIHDCTFDAHNVTAWGGASSIANYRLFDMYDNEYAYSYENRPDSLINNSPLTVAVKVVNSATGLPMSGGTVTIGDDDAASSVTDAGGTALVSTNANIIGAPVKLSYKNAVEQLGTLTEATITSQSVTFSTSIAGDPVPVVVELADSDVTIETAKAAYIYVCTAAAVSSLTVTAVENSPYETVIRFASGDTATTLNLPESLQISWVGAPGPNASYEINIANNLAVIAQFPKS